MRQQLVVAVLAVEDGNAKPLYYKQQAIAVDFNTETLIAIQQWVSEQLVVAKVSATMDSKG